MKHNIKTKEIFLTPAISDYLEKRIAHLDKFVSPENKETIMCYVEIGKTTNHHKNGDLFKAELTIHIGSKSFQVISEKEDLYTAIDMATEEMSEELKSFKEKKISLIRKSGAKIKSLIKGLYETDR